MVAPRMFSTGAFFTARWPPGATAKIEQLRGRAEFHVRRQQEQGAISVKSYNYLRRDQRQQVLHGRP
jgi:hypothetical protein